MGKGGWGDPPLSSERCVQRWRQIELERLDPELVPAGQYHISELLQLGFRLSQPEEHDRLLRPVRVVRELAQLKPGMGGGADPTKAFGVEADPADPMPIWEKLEA